MSFFQPCFSLSSLSYTTLVTYGDSSLLLSEVHYFRGAQNEIKSWYDCALFLPLTWMGFSSLEPCDISQLFVARAIPSLIAAEWV